MRSPLNLAPVFLALSLPLSSALGQAGLALTPASASRDLSTAGCPVKFSAHRKTFWAMGGSNDGRTTPKAAAAQAVQLAFSQSDAGKISKATIIVHGTSSKLQTISTTADAPDDAWTESFLIERSEGASALPTRALRSKALATSNWVEITRIDFADGTIWKERSDAQCVLVAGD